MDFLRLLAAGRCGALDTFFSGLTYFGSEIAFMAAALLIFWCVDKRQGYYVFLVGALGTVCNQFLKLAFRIPRPWVLDPDFQIVEAARADATGYSFPSGHTQNIVGTTASIFASRKEAWVRTVCIVLMVLVPFSRMYLGVHTPLDVGVAFLMAAALLALFYPVFRSEQAMAKGMPWLLSAAVLLAAAFTFYMGGLRVDAAALDGSNFAHAQENAYKLLGAVIALLPVYFLEKRYVKFETGAVWYAQIAKLVLGLGLAMAVKSVLKAPLNALLPGGAGDAIRYFVLVLFAGCIWPLTFRWFGKWGKQRA